jgi:hypothetical protein
VTVVDAGEDFNREVLWIEYQRNGERHEGYVMDEYAVSFVEAEGGLK